MGVMDDQGMLQQEQKEGVGEWSDLERFWLSEVLDMWVFWKREREHFSAIPEPIL